MLVSEPSPSLKRSLPQPEELATFLTCPGLQYMALILDSSLLASPQPTSHLCSHETLLSLLLSPLLTFQTLWLHLLSTDLMLAELLTYRGRLVDDQDLWHAWNPQLFLVSRLAIALAPGDLCDPSCFMSHLTFCLSHDRLLNAIKPGLVKKVNRLPTPIAGLVSIHNGDLFSNIPLL